MIKTSKSCSVPNGYKFYDYIWLPQNTGSSSEPRFRRTSGALIGLKQYSNLDLISYEFDFICSQAYPSNFGVSLLGGRSAGGSTNSCAFYLLGNYGTAAHYHGNDTQTNLIWVLNTKTRVIYQNTGASPSQLIVNRNSEELVWSNTVSIPNTRLHLFANPTPSDLSSMSNLALPTVGVKIGKVKIYDLSGNLINNYIPCVRKSDNVIGMYDTVENVFYTAYQTSYATIGNSNCIYEVGDYDIKKITTKVNNSMKQVQYIKTKILPSEYQEVEYIESTGTQYIDTGYLPNANTIWKLKCYIYKGVEFDEARCGRWGANNDRFSIYVSPNSSGRVEVAIGNYYQETYTYTSSQILNFTVDATTLTGACPEANYSHTYTTQPPFTSQNTLYLFGRNATGSGNTSPDGTYPMRIYSHRIWENGTLVQNFVPCYRKSDNVIGMYDIVSNTFFTNAGSGTFLKGNNVQGTMKKVYDVLPSTYQRVEYITSNGGDYLDTGFVPNNNTKVEVKIKASQDINNIWVFGARQSANNVMYAVILHYNNNTSPLKVVRSDYGTGNESAGAMRFYNTNKNLTQNIITIIKDKNYFYVDNVLAGTHTSQAFTCVNNLYLFKINSANGGNHNSYISMYYAKIWDNDTLIRYYIPCYRKSDNVIGMYDLINGTFTAGTGNFTKGSNV